METGVSYFGSRLPEHVFPDLEAIRDAGCTYVIHTFSEEDLNFYRRNMEEIVAKTKSLGLKAHVDPWGVAGIFGGETFSYFVMRELHARQIKSDGKPGPLACLNHPDLRAFIKKWIDAAADIGADAIFWDEPHFFVPGWFDVVEPKELWGCRCTECNALYRKKYGEDLPDQETDQVREFKHWSLIDFLTEMCAYVAQKGVQNTTCMLPHEDVRDSGLWEEVAAIPHLHGFGTDPYWISRKKYDKTFEFNTYMRPFCKKVREVSEKNNLRGHIWIQNFGIPSGWEPDIEQAIEIAVSEGIEDIAAWTFYGAKGMASLRSDRPEVVWNVLKKTFLKLQKQYTVCEQKNKKRSTL